MHSKRLIIFYLQMISDFFCPRRECDKKFHDLPFGRIRCLSSVCGWVVIRAIQWVNLKRENPKKEQLFCVTSSMHYKFLILAREEDVYLEYHYPIIILKVFTLFFCLRYLLITIIILCIVCAGDAKVEG